MSLARKAAALLCAALLCACAGRKSGSEAKTDTLHERLTAYWQGWSDSGADSITREQRIVDYLYLAGHADSLDRAGAWSALCDALASHPDLTVTDYLGQPDSPLYSPRMLEEYLAALVTRLPDGDAGRLRAEYLLECVRKNLPGEAVADLRLIASDGHTVTLRSLIGACNADCLVLFYDPECDSCEAAIARLSEAPADAGPVIAVSVTSAVSPLPAEWLSVRVADTDELHELHERYYLPELPAAYAVTPAGILRSQLPL